MITSKLKLILVFSVIIFAFSNCEKTPDNQTTVAEDKANIDGLLDEVIAEASALKAGCAVQHADDFFNLNQGSLLNSNWVDMIFNALKNHLSITTYQTSKFDFNSHVGTHSWSSSSQVWTGSSTPNNKIILEFPSQMGQSTNNVKVTADYYTDENVSYNGYSYWFPKTFNAKGEVGTDECYGAHLISATYDNTTYQIPIDAELHLKLSPYTFEIKMNRVAPEKFHVEIRAKNNGTEKFSLVTDLTYTHSNYQNWQIYGDCAKATGTFTFGDFAFPFTADFEIAQNLLNPSDNQINTLFDASLLYKGNEIADFDYAKDINGYADIIIKYSDGTTEDTETYYQEFLDDLEIIVVEFTGAWPN